MLKIVKKSQTYKPGDGYFSSKSLNGLNIHINFGVDDDTKTIIRKARLFNEGSSIYFSC